MKDAAPVTHICCEGGRLVAVIWGRIYWRPLDADWLASRWVPLALPGQEVDATERLSSSNETETETRPRRRARRVRAKPRGAE